MTPAHARHHTPVKSCRPCSATHTVLRLRLAATFLRRLLGVHAKGPLGDDEGLLLTPCNAVHTFFLRQRIDVVFLDGAGAPCRHVAAVAPRRIVFERHARMVVELPSGYCARHPDYPARIQAALRAGSIRSDQ